MGIGTALAFITIGAILAFATRFHLSGIDLQMVGWILIFVGLVMLFITLAYARPRRRRQVVEDVDIVDGQPQPGAYVREVQADEPAPVIEPVQIDTEPEPEVRRRTVRRHLR
jgi:hypothetical protein